MRGLELKSHRRSAAALAGVGALLVTVGCGTARDAGRVVAQQLPAGQSGAPVIVSCEPHQRTLVRPAMVNGSAVSQVECVSAAVAAEAAYAQNAVAQPFAGSPVYAQPTAVRTAQPVYTDLGDAQVIPATRAPRSVVRPVPTRQVVYDERPVKRGRSVKKSAVIIGSSAGVGAGVGAAVGGKKGALIGAAIGGGSAAIWDQVTRR